MKKATLTMYLFAALSIFAGEQAHAQYNRIFPYNISGSWVNSTAVDIIATDAGSTTTLGVAAATGSYHNYILIKKLDPLGNPIFDVVYEYPGLPDGYLRPTKIVQTLGRGYIVTGTFDDPVANKRFPFAAGFDPMGNFLWFYDYPTAMGDNANANIERPSIVYAPDDPTDESYIITLGAQADATSSYPGDCYIDALEINAVGTLKWHNKYMPTWGRSCFADLLDWPQAIVHVDAPGNSFYYIGGTQNWWGAYPCSVGYGYYMTAFGIDYMGNVVQNYTTYTTPQYPFSIDAVYDPNPLQPAVALAYTFGNTTIGNTTTASVIGFTKLDPTLNPILTEIYYMPADVENYGSGIAKTHDVDSGFVISTVNSYGHWNQGILKIDNIGNIDFFNEYNVLANHTGLSPRIADVNFPTENYVMASSVFNSTPGAYDMRITNTTATGYSCGVQDSPIVAEPYTLYPTQYSYTPIAEAGATPFVLLPPPFVANPKDCNSANSGYRQSNTTSAATVSEQHKFDLYPTLLSSNTTINVEAFATAKTKVTMKLYAIDGRYIASQHVDAEQGPNKFTWTLPVIVSGNYFIITESEDKSILETTRISNL